MTELRIENVNINSLTPDPANARKHDGKNLKAIENSLLTFGQRKPIVVTPDSIVVAGNGTLEAAKNLGWTEIAVARTPIGWTWDQIKAFALADNRTAELAEWDDKILADQLLELDATGWNLEEIGFQNLEPPLGDLNDDEPLSFDDAPARSKLGDLWQLGNHRVLCGDSFHEAAIDKLMRNQRADIVYTDPPYGMNLDTDYSKMGSNNSYDKVIGDNERFDASVLLNYFSYCKEIFLWGADYYVETLERQYPNLGSWIIWDKYSDERIGLLDGKFGSSFETCWSKTAHKREIARVLVKTNYTSRGDEARVHPTQKPVELALWFFERYAKNRNVIVDLFGGSGSTLMAAERLSKTALVIELDPKYCDVILKRWENLTGKTAELLED